MHSGITSGRVLNGELLYTKILEVNLFAFAYRLFRRDFSPLDGTYCNMSRRVGRTNANKLTSRIFVYLSIYLSNYNSDDTIHMYSVITSGRVLDGELLYTNILEVNLFSFVYRLFHRDFSPINGTLLLKNAMSR